jgi:hypothetical protein
MRDPIRFQFFPVIRPQQLERLLFDFCVMHTNCSRRVYNVWGPLTYGFHLSHRPVHYSGKATEIMFAALNAITSAEWPRAPGTDNRTGPLEWARCGGRRRVVGSGVGITSGVCHGVWMDRSNILYTFTISFAVLNKNVFLVLSRNGRTNSPYISPLSSNTLRSTDRFLIILPIIKFHECFIRPLRPSCPFTPPLRPRPSGTCSDPCLGRHRPMVATPRGYTPTAQSAYTALRGLSDTLPEYGAGQYVLTWTNLRS